VSIQSGLTGRKHVSYTSRWVTLLTLYELRTSCREAKGSCLQQYYQAKLEIASVWHKGHLNTILAVAMLSGPLSSGLVFVEGWLLDATTSSTIDST
jgi:hypothetical protein